MKTEPIANRCPKCQAPLPQNAPQGLCARCLLAAAATPTEAGQPAASDPAPPLESVAAAFPHLEILQLIGHGGMGVVYKARQPKLDRFVALKLLPQALAADPAFAERFNREARLLARLNHPNIVTVHDFGQSGPFFYLLMEFVDGVNLRQAMQAGRFTPQQALLLVPRICEALQFAHEEGILHRDIKPENILLDSRGRVKIADFGIAKLVGEAKEQLTLTASGLAVGTPHYMAPEQLEHPHDVDQRADIYSLGVVFYEMLTGELPIGRFEPPSKKTPMDPRVDEIVFHALEKEREKRFRSASEVKTSIEAISSSRVAPDSPGGHSEPGAAPGESRATCYFNTPLRMSDCFPSAAARIFTCKGELVLEFDSLTFVSPWRNTIRIPFRDIDDLSIGQFQMWTTPWVMRYARLNFLAVRFRQDGQLQTVHLTPVPSGETPAGEINEYVGRWFERVQHTIQQRTGKIPHASDPANTCVSAEPAWNRKGLLLTFGFCVMWLATWVVLPQRKIPVEASVPILVISVLLLVLTGWFCAGFLRANSALWHGNLDAVTSDEPPVPEPVTPGTAAYASGRNRRWRIGSLSLVGIIVACMLLPLAFLLWEAWVFPSFGQRLFGKRAVANPASNLVLDYAAPDYGPDGNDPRRVGGQVWNYKCLVPPDHLAQVLFITWSNGVPGVQPGFSAYSKTGHAPAGMDFVISCEPKPEAPGSTATNALWWNVYLGLGYTSGGALPAAVPLRMLDTPGRITVVSGHQRVVRLVDYLERTKGPQPQDGVELRILLEPLTTPAIRTVPSEKEFENYIAGPGLAFSLEETLKFMKRLPVDQ